MAAVVVMGVSGSGKTTVARLLAEALSAAFVEADDLHPEANVRKMAGGHPLTDGDRWPWLRAVADVVSQRT
ncbi:MAG TPA: AAA family ATPase, partial [Actinomycetales bacterium]|nr:AAA family ATPase [Actinomycetales bacterium]